MRLILRPLAISLALLLAGAASAQQTGTSSQSSMRGFSPAHAAIERQWEQKFRALPDPARLKTDLLTLADQPHALGSARDFHNAQWLVQQFTSYGLDAHMEKFEVLFPTPAERRVELVSPRHFVASLKEPPAPGDRYSTQAGQLPTYNAYSADGDVTAPLVYVNYGIPADYEQLAKLGISVKGKIVLARYGKSWRGIKPKLAYEHGAVGCIIYSDPRDDGYFQGDIFPKGAWRPWGGVQRGSVMEMEKYPGDPETPGWGSVPGAKRLPLNKVTNLEKIPVLPISYADAEPLLKALGGPVAPEDWRGALPLTYHVGPGPAKVHLLAKFHWNVVPLYDIIVRIPGSTHPDEWVIRGNHYDAWVNGAEDPVSGQAALLEEARAYGELLKQGWRPQRTILYCAWDGEEPALIGSTEWAETHAAELEQHAVVYLNSDTNSKGWLEMGGSHTLERLVNQAAGEITDPETHRPILTKLLQHESEEAKTSGEKAELKDGQDLHMAALGSGSDYSPFLQHLGIASLNLGFSGSGGGVYHSIYDDPYWYLRFGDGSFVYGRALAQTMGTTVLRLADADVLPFQFTDFGGTLLRYQKEVEKLPQQEHGPAFDFSPLASAIQRVRQAAKSYEKAYAAAAQSGALYGESAQQLDALNQTLYHSERSLLSAAGLPGRPWYKHQIYAPGFYTGYGVKTLPGLREALEQKNWTQAAQEQAVIVKALDAFTGQILAAQAKLPGA